MRSVFLIITFFIISKFSFSQTSPALNFSLENINGELVSFDNYTAKGPVYLSFWALWCNSCKSELKALNPLYEKYKEKGLTILAINIDTPKSTAKVKSYISAHKFTMPVLLDPNVKVFELLNGQLLPYSLLIDTNGKILKVRKGFLPGDEKYIEEEISKLLSIN